MAIVRKKIKEIKPMSKEEAKRLREMYKDDNNIDCSDIPELTVDMLAEAQFLQVGEFINKNSRHYQ